MGLRHANASAEDSPSTEVISQPSHSRKVRSLAHLNNKESQLVSNYACKPPVDRIAFGCAPHDDPWITPQRSSTPFPLIESTEAAN